VNVTLHVLMNDLEKNSLFSVVFERQYVTMPKELSVIKILCLLSIHVNELSTNLLNRYDLLLLNFDEMNR